MIRLPGGRDAPDRSDGEPDGTVCAAMTKSARRRIARQRSAETKTVAPVGTAAEAASAVAADAAQRAELQGLRIELRARDARLDSLDGVVNRLAALVDSQAAELRRFQSAVAPVGSAGEDNEETLFYRVEHMEEKIAELDRKARQVALVEGGSGVAEAQRVQQSMQQSWAACLKALEEAEEAEWQEMVETPPGDGGAGSATARERARGVGARGRTHVKQQPDTLLT